MILNRRKKKKLDKIPRFFYTIDFDNKRFYSRYEVIDSKYNTIVDWSYTKRYAKEKSNELNKMTKFNINNFKKGQRIGIDWHGGRNTEFLEYVVWEFNGKKGLIGSERLHDLIKPNTLFKDDENLERFFQPDSDLYRIVNYRVL